MFAAPSKIYGEPTPPQLPAPAPLPQNSAAPSVTGVLEEVSPLIENIEIRRSPVSIEVFLTGKGPLNCYDTREIAIEKKGDTTYLIPRLKRSRPFTPCNTELKVFSEKIADLDPLSPASRAISVLGFRGWHHRLVDAPVQAK